MASTDPYSISRVLKAPRALVYKVSTEPAHMAQWFGPAGAVVIKSQMDLRPGGTYHYGLRMPDGLEMWGKQVYREIVAPEKLVYIQSFSDKDGGITRHPMSPTWPLEMLATTAFEDLGNGQTRMTVTWLPYNADEAATATFDGARPSMHHGFEGMFVSLENYLATL
jgi:uncharacterized protein YndB with AHSA1/START domain